MKSRKLRPREASVESKDALVKSREDYKKQWALPVVTLESPRAGVALFVDYSMKY